MFSYVSLEARIPADHPLRAMREMVDTALKRLSPRFASLYADGGRPSIPPERLLRALLVQVLYSIRSERLLMEQLEYNLLFRWFVGLGIDDRVGSVASGMDADLVLWSGTPFEATSAVIGVLVDGELVLDPRDSTE